jgi:hypothetical protein
MRARNGSRPSTPRKPKSRRRSPPWDQEIEIDATDEDQACWADRDGRPQSGTGARNRVPKRASLECCLSGEAVACGASSDAAGFLGATTRATLSRRPRAA